MFPKAVKQSKAGLSIAVHFFNKGQMFPAPAALGKLVSSEKGLRFDGYAWLSGCGTAQLIIVAGSVTLDDVPPLNSTRYANGGNAGLTRREESHSQSRRSKTHTDKKRIYHTKRVIAPKESSRRVNIYSERGMKQYLQLCNFSTIAAEEAVDQ